MPKIKPTGHGGVYEIVNLVNGKRYIGSAAYFGPRWSQHKRELRLNTHHTPHLQHSWNKYGESEFSFRVLEIVPEPTRQRLIDCENKWFKELGYHYNVCPVAGSTLGVKHSATARRNMKNAWKGYWRSHPEAFARREAARMAALNTPEVRVKLGSGKRGVPHTEEHKAHMREKMAGNTNGTANKGRVISQESRQKMRAAKLGTKRSPEAIAKGAAASAIARTGQKRTDEQRARMADAARNRTDANRYVPPAGVRPEHLFSAEVAAKRVAAQTGLKRTPEQCARIADAMRKYTPEEMVIRRRASVKACKDRAKAKRLVDRLAE